MCELTVVYLTSQAGLDGKLYPPMISTAQPLPPLRYEQTRLSSPGLHKQQSLKKERWQAPCFKEWDTASTDPASMYKILMGGLIPRPIAFVSTIASNTGYPNLSPFSMIQIVSAHPLVLMLTASRPCPARVKETAEAINHSKQFTVNILSNSTVGQQLGSSTSLYVEEWIERGVIHWTDSASISPPRIAESAFSLECELFQPKGTGLRIDPSVSRANVILGVVKRLYVRSDVLNSGGNMVDPAKLDPILRLNTTL